MDRGMPDPRRFRRAYRFTPARTVADVGNRRALVHACAVPVGDQPPGRRYSSAGYRVVRRRFDLPEDRCGGGCGRHERDSAWWRGHGVWTALQLRNAGGGLAGMFRQYATRRADRRRRLAARPGAAEGWLADAKRGARLWPRDPGAVAGAVLWRLTR